jgi:hypothetical protein
MGTIYQTEKRICQEIVLRAAFRLEAADGLHRIEKFKHHFQRVHQEDTYSLVLQVGHR